MKTAEIIGPRQALDGACDRPRWSLGKNGRHIEVSLYCSDRGAALLRVRRDGELCADHQFDREWKAVEYAQALDCDLRAHGWQPDSL